MKRKLFTILFGCAFGFAYAQDASDFGAKDVLITNFEDKVAVVTDSLWTDTLMTTPITVSSTSISLADNPFPLENTSATAAKYIRPAGAWRTSYIRLDKSISLSETPYLQIQVYPVLGKSPAKSSVSINLINDKGEIAAIGGFRDNIPQDEWTTVLAFLGRQKSSVKYNAIQISINNGDSVATNEETEYYIDQIGFKAPADGVALPATIFYETFGGWNGDWQDGKVPGQHVYPKSDGSGYNGPGEFGTAEAYASVNGFTSGIPFTYRDLVADTTATFVARTWGMKSKYDGASSGGRVQLSSYMPGTLETGVINVTGSSDLTLSFGIGTQQWWPYNSEIANARPKVEISVNGGEFYEIYSNSQFLQFTGEQVDLGWGLMDKYEDEIFTLVEYPLTTIDGDSLTGLNTVNLRMTYKSGTDFWIDDMWLSAKTFTTGVSTLKADAFKVYPNPATDYILTPGAQNVTITDLNGRVVVDASNSEKVNVSALAKGIYIVKVLSDNATQIGKLIKE